jgi:hypothetical protein
MISAAETFRALAAVGSILVLSLLTGPLTPAGARPAKGEETMFPSVGGSNLEGRPFNLPRDFEGRLNLVFVAFQREQQPDVDTWVPLAKAIAARYPHFRYYELPTIYRANAMVRWFIDSGMRRGIADPDARRSTITLYLDKEEFRSALGIDDEQSIHVFLVRPDGRVIWRTKGVLTDDDGKALENMVAVESATPQD